VKYIAELKKHVVDTTAIVAESNPIFGAVELGLIGMTPAASLNSRVLATTVGYLGLARLYSSGRDFSRRIFNITDQTRERVQAYHDLAYAVTFNFAFSPIMYAAAQRFAGEDLDWKKIALGTGMSLLLGAANGIPLGYSIDVFRDLTGIEECKRPSYFLKKQSPRVKRLALAGIIALSLGVTGLMYSGNTEVEIAQPVTKISLENIVE